MARFAGQQALPILLFLPLPPPHPAFMWVLGIQPQAAMCMWHFTHSATSPASLMYIFNASTRQHSEHCAYIDSCNSLDRMEGRKRFHFTDVKELALEPGYPGGTVAGDRTSANLLPSGPITPVAAAAVSLLPDLACCWTLLPALSQGSLFCPRILSFLAYPTPVLPRT